MRCPQSPTGFCLLTAPCQSPCGQPPWLTCEHGVIGYCEPCALRDPGEYGEEKPRLVYSKDKP